MGMLSDLLDKVRVTCSLPSEQALADRLNVSRQTVHDWRKGNKPITNEHLALVVHLSHATPAEAVEVRKELAKSDHERALWRSVARQLGAAAVLAVVAALPLASQAAVSAGKFAGNAYYVLRRWLTPRLAIPSRATLSPA